MKKINRALCAKQMSLNMYRKYPTPRNWKKIEITDVQKNVKWVSTPNK